MVSLVNAQVCSSERCVRVNILSDSTQEVPFEAVSDMQLYCLLHFEAFSTGVVDAQVLG